MLSRLISLPWLYISYCWITGTTSQVYKPHFGSVLVVKPTAKYQILNGTIQQYWRPSYETCEDTKIKYSWNGSHFLIGSVLSSYTGTYVMSLQNTSRKWGNGTYFDIMVEHNRPHVESQKIVVDQGDSVNFTCTYQSNCVLPAMWTKDGDNSLDPVVHKRIGNNTNVLTYMLTSAEKYFATDPYFCLLSIDDKNSLEVKLEVKDFQKPYVTKMNGSSWFEENSDALIYFSILGSPLPNLTCIDETTKQNVLSCSTNQMKDLLYAGQSKPCKSASRKYILSSQSKQTGKVRLRISKVKLERDNGAIVCHLHNSKHEREDFRLVVNVKVLSEVNVTVNSEGNSSYINCIVRSNPPPEISWEKCNISETTSCESVKVDKAAEKVPKELETYKSNISLDTSYEHVINCKAKNRFWSNKGSYVYKFNDDKIEDNDSNITEGKRYLFIAVGCGLLLLLLVAFALALYIKERRRNNAYKRFFLANNNYTIDPLKTLNEQMHNLSYDEDWEFPYMYLEFNELIGCGAFGKVYKANAYGIGLLNSRDKSQQARKQRRQFNKARGKMKLVHAEENECMTVAVKTTKGDLTAVCVKV